MSIELSFPFCLRDRLRAEVALSAARPRTIFAMYVVPVLGVAFLALVWLGTFPAGVAKWWFLGVVAASLPVGVLLGVSLAFFRNPSRHEPFRYLIDDAGIHVISTSQSFTHNWSSIQRAKQQLGFFMLFFRPDCAHCLPLSAVESSGCLPALIRLIRQQNIPFSISRR